MSKRKTLINVLLLTVVLASFAATIVSGGFMVSAVLAHTSNSIVNSSFINTLVSMSLLLVSFTLLQIRLNNRDNRETQSKEDQFEQKYISMFSDDTKARREFVELYKKKESV